MEGINAMLEICFPKDVGIPCILWRNHEWKRHWISLQIGETETESQGGKVCWIRDLSRIRVSSSPSALFRLLAIDVNILGTFLLSGNSNSPSAHMCWGDKDEWGCTPNELQEQGQQLCNRGRWSHPAAWGANEWSSRRSQKSCVGQLPRHQLAGWLWVNHRPSPHLWISFHLPWGEAVSQTIS